MQSNQVRPAAHEGIITNTRPNPLCLSSQILKISKDGDFTAFRGNLRYIPSVKVFPLVQPQSLVLQCVAPFGIVCHYRGAVGFVTFATPFQVAAGCSCSISSLPSSCSSFSWCSQPLDSPPLLCPVLSPLKLGSFKLDPGAEKTGKQLSLVFWPRSS